MKALSLWQPWATLMAYDLKKIETRHWPTKYRGLIAIHAAKKIVRPADINTSAWIFPALDYLGLEWESLPTGSILAVRKLVDCNELKHCGGAPNAPKISQGSMEKYFGDYRDGRYEWVTENIRTFKKPIPFTGRQGLFNVPDEALRVCRVCGCSEFNACPGGCSWVEEDLCSACASSVTFVGSFPEMKSQITDFTTEIVNTTKLPKELLGG
jgi:hypothetical protein